MSAREMPVKAPTTLLHKEARKTILSHEEFLEVNWFKRILEFLSIQSLQTVVYIEHDHKILKSFPSQNWQNMSITCPPYSLGPLKNHLK